MVNSINNEQVKVSSQVSNQNTKPGVLPLDAQTAALMLNVDKVLSKAQSIDSHQPTAEEKKLQESYNDISKEWGNLYTQWNTPTQSQDQQLQTNGQAIRELEQLEDI